MGTIIGKIEQENVIEDILEKIVLDYKRSILKESKKIHFGKGVSLKCGFGRSFEMFFILLSYFA